MIYIESKRGCNMSDQDKIDMVKVQSYVPKKWKEAIKEIHKTSGISESAQIKIALETYLKGKGKIN
jgi:hypothetical protein